LISFSGFLPIWEEISVDVSIDVNFFEKLHFVLRTVDFSMAAPMVRFSAILKKNTMDGLFFVRCWGHFFVDIE